MYFVCTCTPLEYCTEPCFTGLPFRWCNEHLAGVLEQINFEVDLHSVKAHYILQGDCCIQNVLRTIKLYSHCIFDSVKFRIQNIRVNLVAPTSHYASSVSLVWQSRQCCQSWHCYSKYDQWSHPASLLM